MDLWNVTALFGKVLCEFLTFAHSLELSGEKKPQLNQDKMNPSTPINILGSFVPLKLQMEFKAS